MIRTRRLKRDYEKVVAELARSEFVEVRVVGGNPPSQYQVTYRVNGVVWDDSRSETIPVGEHIVDIHLPIGYPKQPPRCVMRSPAWHPNIGDYVCIGDFWSAGVTLVDIIAHIGDMIQYRTYNLHSPVNKAAAQWAQRNAKSFPIGTRQILPPETDEIAPVVVELPAPGDGLEIKLGPARERRA